MARVLRTLHIGAGMLALAVFAVPLIAKKGAKLHRRVGWVYVGAMFTAAATAAGLVPIRMMQRPRSQWVGPFFLGYIAILSFTAAFYGVRVLRQKRRTGRYEGIVDWIPPALLLVAAAASATYGYVADFGIAIYFAPVALPVALPQLVTLASKPKDKRWWLFEHLSGMLISCIATLTAFAVVNASWFGVPSDSPLVWFAPTILFVPMIIYWKRRGLPRLGERAG